MVIGLGHQLVGKLDILPVSELSDKSLQDNNESICLQQLFRKVWCSKHKLVDQRDSEDLFALCW